MNYIIYNKKNLPNDISTSLFPRDSFDESDKDAQHVLCVAVSLYVFSLIDLSLVLISNIQIKKQDKIITYT